MKLGDRLVDGVFLERPNRYLAHVEIDGRRLSAHVPDPGRLPGLMKPGRRVRLIHNPGPQRKTDYSLVLVRHGAIWVSVYPVFANRLIAQALGQRQLSCLSGYREFQKESKMGSSRFDFRIEFPDRSAFVEIKSVSYVEKGLGRFPDAPTVRGARHLKELIELKAQGNRAVVIFVSQRSDARTVSPNDEIDPHFGECLRAAHRQGVELYAYNCRVTASTVALNQPLKVVLP